MGAPAATRKTCARVRRAADPDLHPSRAMWSVLGATVDVAHALMMAAWVVGLPLLFWHQWPRATRAYGVYAIVFIVVSQVSHAILGECFLTTLARACWLRAPLSGGASPVSDEWFTVRLARFVFRLSPSHRAISLASEALILLTAVGALLSIRKLRTTRSGLPPLGSGSHGRV